MRRHACAHLKTLSMGWTFDVGHLHGQVLYTGPFTGPDSTRMAQNQSDLTIVLTLEGREGCKHTECWIAAAACEAAHLTSTAGTQNVLSGQDVLWMFAASSADAGLLSIRTSRMKSCMLTAEGLTELGAKKLGTTKGEVCVAGQLADDSLLSFRNSSVEVPQADSWSAD